MTDIPETHVARLLRTATWTLLRGRETVGRADAVCRPDRRWFVSVDTWDPTAYEPLLAAVDDDLRHDLYTNVDADDQAELDRWHGLGFAVARREAEFSVPVDPAVTGLGDARAPAGLVLLSADAVDEHGLRELDDALRTDVPGSRNWRNDPAEFRDYTFDERHYDPATYLVAVDDARQRFAGLVRVWGGRSAPRLGMIAVLPGYRRAGLARALLAAAFAPLHERGIERVVAEVDTANGASLGLLRGAGGRPTGVVAVELVRRMDH